MKKLLYILGAIALILSVAQCAEMAPDEPKLSVTVDKNEIKIKKDGPETINYTVINAKGEITVALPKNITDIQIENKYDAKESKGKITFSTENENKVHYELNLIFKDEKNEYEVPFTIDISSVWNIVPL